MILNGDFEWRETAGGLALVCRALEPYAPHVFTTREWRLGTNGGGDRAAAWAVVARALGVDEEHLVRMHQVHGASVAIRRRDDPLPEPASLPHADIVLSDDPARVLAVQ